MSADNHTPGRYTSCGCRDCFDIAISPDDGPALCGACSEAECEINAGECNRDDLYVTADDIAEPTG